MTHRSQLVKAGEELVEGHDQFLGSTLGCQAGEAFDVSKQDAGRQEEEDLLYRLDDDCLPHPYSKS